jgi:thiol-disulfide isomerase/thioredoxin
MHSTITFLVVLALAAAASTADAKLFKTMRVPLSTNGRCSGAYDDLDKTCANAKLLRKAFDPACRGVGNSGSSAVDCSVETCCFNHLVDSTGPCRTRDGVRGSCWPSLTCKHAGRFPASGDGCTDALERSDNKCCITPTIGDLDVDTSVVHDVLSVEALEKFVQTGKKVVVLFTAGAWCLYCKLMDNMYVPDVMKATPGLLWVRINSDEAAGLSLKGADALVDKLALKGVGVPAFRFFDVRTEVVSMRKAGGTLASTKRRVADFAAMK